MCKAFKMGESSRRCQCASPERDLESIVRGIAARMTTLTSEPAYQQLQDYYNKNGASINILELFAKDPDRFNNFR